MKKFIITERSAEGILRMRSIKRLLKRARIIFATLQDWKIEVPDVGATAALLARHGLDGGADYRIEREP